MEKDIFDLEDDDIEETVEENSSEDTSYIQDVDNLVQELIDKAIANVHEPFGQIRTISALIAAKTILAATKHVYKNFKRSMMNMFKAYRLTLKMAPTEDTFDILLTYKCMQHCAEYYKVECKNILEAIDECYNYILSGHLTDFLS